MKRWSLVLALLCSAFAAGCSANDTEEDHFFVTPEEVIAIPENGGSYEYYLGTLEAPDDMVVVSAQSLDPAKATILFENGGSSIVLPAGQEKVPYKATVTCIDDHIQNGDQYVDILFMTASNDSDFNGLGEVRQIVCRAGQVIPDPGLTDPPISQDPVQPDEPQDPVEPDEPQDPVEPDEPQDPVQPDEPQDPVQPEDPVIPNPPATTKCQFTVSRTSIDVFEGGHASFTIVPGQAPTSNILITPSVSDDSEGEVTSGSLSFSTSNWQSTQTVEIYGKRDGADDGDQSFEVKFNVVSSDPRYDGCQIASVKVRAIDTEGDNSVLTGKPYVKIRAMAANITSGNYSAYSPGHGVRIFKAVKPDIVMIQEFNWYRSDESDQSAFKLIEEAFDSSYYVHRGNGSIPNGIISRYPIIDSGYWKSNKQNNRDWDWAIVDLPGPKELLVISVHLGTDTNTAEVPSLMNSLKSKVTADSKKKLTYFTMIGGDFNRNYEDNKSLKDFFKTDGALPKDQSGDSSTNAARKKTLDHLFVDKDFDRKEIPVEIGGRSYANGHVFDSRVYKRYGELGSVSPVQGDDSGATNMQHMAVIRDFEYYYE